MAFGGFLFLRCLGLGFVLELVLGDEGGRSEAPSPGWRLSRGGRSQERSPEGLPALARSPRLQTRSGGCSRELGSDGKTSLAWFSLFQPGKQGLLHLGGAHAAFSRTYAAAITFQAPPPFLLLPLFSPAQKDKPKRLLWAPGGCEQICLPELGGGCFPSTGIRDPGGTLGLSLAPFHIQLPGFFINTIANCLCVRHHLRFFFKAHFCKLTLWDFCLFLVGFFFPFTCLLRFPFPLQ